MTDSIVYWLLTGLLVVTIVWLLFTPAPGRAPLVTFTHASLVR